MNYLSHLIIQFGSVLGRQLLLSHSVHGSLLFCFQFLNIKYF